MNNRNAPTAEFVVAQGLVLSLMLGRERHLIGMYLALRYNFADSNFSHHPHTEPCAIFVPLERRCG